MEPENFIKQLTNIVALGCLSLVLLTGIYIFFLGVRNMVRGVASTHWPKARATVVRSEIQTDTSFDQKTRRSSTDYLANILFRYQIYGRDYTTSTLHFGQVLGSSNIADAQLRLLRYPSGAEVDVSYNPDNPSIAAAEPGFNAEALWLVGAGMAFILPCIMAGSFLYGTLIKETGSGLGAGIGVGIFAGIFATIGLMLLGFGLLNLWRAHLSEQWPKASGVITYQKTDEDQSDGSSGTFSTALVFQYEVNGKKCYGNLCRFGQLAGGSAEDAEQTSQKYPQGQVVNVSYFPDNPNLSVLEPGIDSQAYWVPGIGLVFLLFALATYIWILPAVMEFG